MKTVLESLKRKFIRPVHIKDADTEMGAGVKKTSRHRHRGRKKETLHPIVFFTLVSMSASVFESLFSVIKPTGTPLKSKSFICRLPVEKSLKCWYMDSTCL